MAYASNPLHPKALYLNEKFWHATQTPDAPEPPADRPASVDRLRITLPAGTPKPKGWHHVKTTRFGLLTSANAKPPASFSIRAIPPQGPFREDWARLAWQHYVETHGDNPPELPPGATPADLFIDEAALPLGLIGGFEGSTLSAISSFELPSASSPELGLTGLPGRCAPDHLAALIAFALEQARSTGHPAIEIEVDSTDTALSSACETLQIDWTERYETYQRRLTPPDTSA